MSYITEERYLPSGMTYCYENAGVKMYLYNYMEPQWVRFIGINSNYAELVKLISNECLMLTQADPTNKERDEARFNERVMEDYHITKRMRESFSAQPKQKKKSVKEPEVIDEELLELSRKQISSINFEKEMIQYKDGTQLMTTPEELKQFREHGDLYDDVQVFVIGSREDLINADIQEFNVTEIDGVYFVEPTPIPEVQAMSVKKEEVNVKSLTALQRAILLSEGL